MTLENPILFLALWIFFWLLPLYVVFRIALWLVTLPMRRREQARFFLDLLESGLKQGRSVEQSIVEMSRSGDKALGRQIHPAAKLIQQGARFGEAFNQAPGFLPPEIMAMLGVGEEMGDIRKVFSACRELLKDGASQVRSALNYVVVFAFVLTPALPFVFFMFRVFIEPKLRAILGEMMVASPAAIEQVIRAGTWMALGQLVLAALFYLIAVLYIGGPRLRMFLKRKAGTVVDEVLLGIPWRRQRLLRDFSRMLALLLDAEVPEGRAVQLAARSTANDAFIERAGIAVRELSRGRKLTDVVQQLDDSGQFLWRIRNAVHGGRGFTASLAAWFEWLDARAFQKEQAAAHLITTSLVLLNGVMVGLIATTLFGFLTAIVNEGVLW